MFEIGSTLREARVRRGLTLQQVEEDVKIRVKYVQAMENEDFDLMPGPTYIKGFLRTYAEYLGLDPELVLDEYRSRGTSSSAVMEPFGGVSMLGKPRSHRGRNTILFVAVICLLVLAVIWILGRGGGESPQLPTQPGTIGLTSPSASPTPSPVPTSTPGANVADIVKITAKTGDCWVEVRRDGSTGVILYSGTIKQGEKRKFRGKRLWISFGNPGAVVLIAGGKKVKLGSAVGPWPVEVVKGRVRQGTQTQGGP